MFKVLSDIMSIPELRRRIFVVFALLAVYRIGFHIYLPGVNIDALNDWLESAREDGGGTLFDFIQITSALTGGQLSNATIFSLGIMPYISASIIFSLLVKVFPKLEALQKEGDSGRQTINRYTRYSTVLLCIIQSLFVVKFLHTPLGRNIGTLSEGWEMACLQVLVLTAGTIFLMWLGEKMTEFGIGNGVSLIIMAGIIAAMPGGLLMLGDQVVNAPADEKPFEVLRVIILLVLFFLIVLGVVYITRGQRRIPVQQARTVKGRRVYGGQRHYMPIRVNSAGVLPIIFAQSLIMLPTGLVTFMAGQGNWFTDLFAYGSFAYMIVYVVMIGFFTYFWTSLMFNPVEMSQNMKEYGSFIPGIRPGRRTAEYL
ncbi:MAG: preprotein translocase subunit SecY, partial [Planctomycetota bacterium]